MDGLRVLLVGPYPYITGKVIGGVEAVVSTLAKALAMCPEIAQLTVLSFFNGSMPAKTEQITDKLQVIHLPGQRKLALPTRSYFNYLQAKQLKNTLKPHLVHGQGIGPIGDLSIRLDKLPVVTAHGLVHVEARMASKGTPTDRLRVWLAEGMVQRVLKHARVTISTSEYDALSLKSYIHCPHVTIANPVAPEFFIPADSPKGNTILFAGMLVRRKNIEGILHALVSVRQHVPEARLVVVGPTPDPIYQREIHEIVKTHHLEKAVIFRGLVENYELVRELAQSRCLVLFSQEETSPTIIAQAMAAGRAVVASKVGGIPELVMDGKNGFLVSSKDEQTLAKRLITLLESPELCKYMGDQGHAIALERFQPASVARQTIAAYRLALES